MSATTKQPQELKREANFTVTTEISKERECDYVGSSPLVLTCALKVYGLPGIRPTLYRPWLHEIINRLPGELQNAVAEAARGQSSGINSIDRQNIKGNKHRK